VSNRRRGGARSPGRTAPGRRPAGQNAGRQTGTENPGHKAAPQNPAPSARRYPGQRFGLPEEGPGSVSGFGRRLAALVIDWLLCTVIALTAFRSQYWTIAVFAGEVYLLTALAGFTVGKRLMGIRVVRLDGRPVGPFWSAVRTVLLLCVVPPLVFDRDLRGLHDKAAGTIVLRV
jgi:RDD family